MADDTEVTENEEGADIESGAKKKKLIVFGGIGLLLALIIGGAVWFFLLRETPEEPPAEGDVAEETAEGESAESDDSEDGVDISENSEGPALYVRMSPPILTSYFQGERIRNFQLRSTLVTRNEDTASAIRAHMPKLADVFATRLRDLSLKQVMDPQVRIELRTQMTELANQVLSDVGADANVEATLFEQVVVQ